MGEDFEGTQTVEVNGATLAYLEQGQAEPVVFVHGSASDLRTWHHQFAAIGATHRVIVYSRRYARPNQPIPEGADDPMLPHVDDLVNFLGTRPFFYSQVLSVADLAVYAMLHTMGNDAIPGAARLIAERPSLVAFIQRVEDATGD